MFNYNCYLWKEETEETLIVWHQFEDYFAAEKCFKTLGNDVWKYYSTSITYKTPSNPPYLDKSETFISLSQLRCKHKDLMTNFKMFDVFGDEVKDGQRYIVRYPLGTEDILVKVMELDGFMSISDFDYDDEIERFTRFIPFTIDQIKQKVYEDRINELHRKTYFETKK